MVPRLLPYRSFRAGCGEQRERTAAQVCGHLMALTPNHRRRNLSLCCPMARSWHCSRRDGLTLMMCCLASALAPTITKIFDGALCLRRILSRPGFSRLMARNTCWGVLERCRPLAPERAVLNGGAVARPSQRLHRMEPPFPALENVHHFVAQQGGSASGSGFGEVAARRVSECPWRSRPHQSDLLLLFPSHSDAETLGLIKEGPHASRGHWVVEPSAQRAAGEHLATPKLLLFHAGSAQNVASRCCGLFDRGRWRELDEQQPLSISQLVRLKEPNQKAILSVLDYFNRCH